MSKVKITNKTLQVFNLLCKDKKTNKTVQLLPKDSVILERSELTPHVKVLEQRDLVTITSVENIVTV